jgi:hypothetical protein
MLEMAWEGVKNNRGPEGLPSPYLVEVIALLERALAYGYTGSAKVISRGLMEPLFTSRSLVLHGFPTINRSVVQASIDRKTQKPFLLIDYRAWPLRDRLSPAICSASAQKMYYSSTMFEVSAFQDWPTCMPSERLP